MAEKQALDFDKEVLFNFSLITDKLNEWVNGTIQLLPNLLVAIVMFAIFYMMARAAKTIFINKIIKQDNPSLGIILGGLIKWVLLIFGFLFSATIVLPSLNIGDLVSGLGIGSVAIGFAFKDILQNWLAGLLILLKQPFKIGDVIAVNGHEGVVESIETRSTMIKKFNAERILIPNSQIYTSAIEVKTAYQFRRFEYEIGIGYSDDIDHASIVILDALNQIEGVYSDPAPDIATVDLAASWVTLRVRWWVDSATASPYTVKADVLKSIKKTLDKNGIDMPFETQVNLFHNQTEEVDGVRGEQREGWPKST